MRISDWSSDVCSSDLHEVESLVDKLRRSERDFRERAERAETRLHMAENPDEEAMLELLGEETTRVLTSAREAAGEIRSKAEAAAERLIAEASAGAGATRAADRKSGGEGKRGSGRVDLGGR